MTRGRQALLFICAFIFGLSAGVPSLDLMVQVLSNSDKGVQSIIGEPFVVTEDSPLSKEALLKYLSRHHDVDSVDEVISILAPHSPPTGKTVSISLAPSELSRETKRLFDSQKEIFYIGETPQGTSENPTVKIFQRIDPINDNANELYTLWTSLFAESDTTQQGALLLQIQAISAELYSLNHKGLVRRVKPGETLATLSSSDAPAVVALPADSFATYSHPGETLDLSKAILDFVSLTKDKDGTYHITKLRDYLPGCDPDALLAVAETVESGKKSLAFLFPLQVTATTDDNSTVYAANVEGELLGTITGGENNSSESISFDETTSNSDTSSEVSSELNTSNMNSENASLASEGTTSEGASESSTPPDPCNDSNCDTSIDCGCLNYGDCGWLMSATQCFSAQPLSARRNL